MPADARPVAAAQPLPGAVPLRRLYVDALGRPMSGRARISGVERVKVGSTVIAPAPVNAEVVNGTLAVELPPGRYTVSAALTTVDGNRVDDTETVTLAAAAEPELVAEVVEEAKPVTMQGLCPGCPFRLESGPTVEVPA